MPVQEVVYWKAIQKMTQIDISVPRTTNQKSYLKKFSGGLQPTTPSETTFFSHTGHQCFYAFLACNRASCLTQDVTRHHLRHVSSWVMWLCMLRANTSLPKQRFAFFIFYSAFLLTDHKNLQQQDNCSWICNVLVMISGVIETFAKCHSYRFLWPWFSL